MVLQLPGTLKLPCGITLKSLYQISNQSIWFLIWILKKDRFEQYLIREALETPFRVEKDYWPSAKIVYFKILKNNRKHSVWLRYPNSEQLLRDIYWPDIFFEHKQQYRDDI